MLESKLNAVSKIVFLGKLCRSSLELLRHRWLSFLAVFAVASRCLAVTVDVVVIVLTRSYSLTLLRAFLITPLTAVEQHGNFIYWTDWQTKSVERADKSSGKKRSIIRDNIERPMDIKMVAATRQTGTNTCAGPANGGCTHLCLFRPQGHICACPTNELAPSSAPCSTHPVPATAPPAGGATTVSSMTTTSTQSPVPSKVTPIQNTCSGFACAALAFINVIFGDGTGRDGVPPAFVSAAAVLSVLFVMLCVVSSVRCRSKPSDSSELAAVHSDNDDSLKDIRDEFEADSAARVVLATRRPTNLRHLQQQQQQTMHQPQYEYLQRLHPAQQPLPSQHQQPQHFSYSPSAASRLRQLHTAAARGVSYSDDDLEAVAATSRSIALDTSLDEGFVSSGRLASRSWLGGADKASSDDQSVGAFEGATEVRDSETDADYVAEEDASLPLTAYSACADSNDQLMLLLPSLQPNEGNHYRQHQQHHQCRQYVDGGNAGNRELLVTNPAGVQQVAYTANSAAGATIGVTRGKTPAAPVASGAHQHCRPPPPPSPFSRDNREAVRLRDDALQYEVDCSDCYLTGAMMSNDDDDDADGFVGGDENANEIVNDLLAGEQRTVAMATGNASIADGSAIADPLNDGLARERKLVMEREIQIEAENGDCGEEEEEVEDEEREDTVNGASASESGNTYGQNYHFEDCEKAGDVACLDDGGFNSDREGDEDDNDDYAEEEEAEEERNYNVEVAQTVASPSPVAVSPLSVRGTLRLARLSATPYRQSPQQQLQQQQPSYHWSQAMGAQACSLPAAVASAGSPGIAGATSAVVQLAGNAAAVVSTATAFAANQQQHLQHHQFSNRQLQQQLQQHLPQPAVAGSTCSLRRMTSLSTSADSPASGSLPLPFLRHASHQSIETDIL